MNRYQRKATVPCYRCGKKCHVEEIHLLATYNLCNFCLIREKIFPRWFCSKIGEKTVGKKEWSWKKCFGIFHIQCTK